EEGIVAAVRAHEVGLLPRRRGREPGAGLVKQNRRSALRRKILQLGRTDSAGRGLIESSRSYGRGASRPWMALDGWIHRIRRIHSHDVHVQSAAFDGQLDASGSGGSICQTNRHADRLFGSWSGRVRRIADDQNLDGISAGIV